MVGVSVRIDDVTDGQRLRWLSTAARQPTPGAAGVDHRDTAAATTKPMLATSPPLADLQARRVHRHAGLHLGQASGVVPLRLARMRTSERPGSSAEQPGSSHRGNANRKPAHAFGTGLMKRPSRPSLKLAALPVVPGASRIAPPRSPPMDMALLIVLIVT